MFPVVDGLVPSFPPLQDSSGFLALQNILPVSSLFFSYLPPLRPFLCIQPTPSSVWTPHRPSPIVCPSESYQPFGYQPTNVLSWFPDPAPHMQVCTPPPTCAAGGTWLGCGWRGEGDGAPRDGLESLGSSAGVARVACLFRR